MQEMILHSVCDLVGLANKFGGNIKGFDITAKVISRVDVPGAFRRNADANVDWVRCGMLWTHISKSFVNKSSNNVEFKTFIDKTYKAVHFLYGCIDIAVPKGIVVDDEGNILLKYIKAQGNISADKYNKAQLYMQSWLFDNGQFIFKPATVVPLNVEGETPAIQTVFHNVEKSSMGRLMSLGAFDTRCMIQAGIRYENSIKDVVIAEETRVLVDDEGIITGRVAAEGQQGMMNIFKPVEMHQITIQEEIMPEPNEKGKFTWKGRTYYNRNEFYMNEGFIGALSKKLETAREKVKNLAAVLDTYTYYDYSKIKQALIMALNTGYNVKAGDGFGVTGRHLLHNVLEKALSLGYFGSVTTDDIESYNSNVHATYVGNTIKCRKEEANELYTYITDNSVNAMDFLTVWATPNANNVPEMYLPLYIRSAQLIYLFIAEILHIRSDLTSLMDCSGSALALIADNPYNLGFIDSSVSIMDMDKLAMLFGKFGKESVKETRCIAFMHSIMTDDNNTVVNSRTCVDRATLETKLKYGFEVNGILARQLAGNPGYSVSKGILTNVQTYLSPLYNDQSFKLPSNNKVAQGTKVYYLMDADISKAIATYVDSGLGVAFASVGGIPSICDYTLLNKEFEIHKFCKQLSEQPIKEYAADVKEQLLNEFEAGKGFKLEEKQRAAVLMDTNVFALLGAAGTGKTTIAEAILYRLQVLENIDDDEIVFLAPTGCASNCLKASVKRKAYTIHSKLHLGFGNGNKGIKSTKQGTTLSDAKVVIIDECSMITVDLMHILLSHIDKENTRVYFLGDIAQLPPIGFGKPFANMLNYLPCVTLNVSKRATSNSMITRNANALLDTLDNTTVEGTDFKLVPATDSTVQAELLRQYKHYIGVEPCNSLPVIPGITKDDVQIVTPVKKDKYTWGAESLNTLLRDIANPLTATTKVITYLDNNTEQTYRTGDRVIHLKNHPNAIRYVEAEPNTFVQMSTEDFGVMNGDVGKIHKFVDGAVVNFVYDNDGDLDINTVVSKDLLYMFVEYSDVDIVDGSPIKYLIAYPLHKIMVNNKMLVETQDLQEISLAYALTTHKMQGSASKVILAPLLDLAYAGDFLNNNMLYTMITRASKMCILTGAVTGDYNIISRIRKIFVLDKRKSLFDTY